MRAACVLLSLLMWFGAPLRAQETSAPPPPLRDPAEEEVQPLGAFQHAVSSAAESREDRAKTRWTVLGSYSYFDTWVPSKFGAAVVYNENASNSYELGYARGGVGFDYFRVSIGRVSDERVYLVWRRFGGYNSFNVFFGLHHEAYRIKLGNDLMRTVSGMNSSVNLLELSTAGPTFGVGNRWQTRGGFVWSFDWLAIHVPLWTLKTRTGFLDASSSASARKDVEDVLKLLRNIPTGAVVKVQLGYAF